MRFRLSNLLIAMAVAAGVAACFSRIDKPQPNTNWSQIDKLIDEQLMKDIAIATAQHLAAGNKWPNSWDDLEPHLIRENTEAGYMDQVRERIEFDFSHEAEERIRSATKEDIYTLRLIRPIRKTSDSTIADAMVFHYMHSAPSAHSAVNP